MFKKEPLQKVFDGFDTANKPEHLRFTSLLLKKRPRWLTKANSAEFVVDSREMRKMSNSEMQVYN